MPTLYDLHSIPFTLDGAGMLSVEDAAALAAYDDAAISSGGLAYVQTYRDYFQKAPGAVPALTATIIPTASGDGGWYRLVGMASPTWVEQADWYIDGVAGSDEGSGAIAEPLLTHDEFMRRIGQNQLTQNLTVNFVDAFTGDFSHTMDAGQQRGYSVLYKGPDLSTRTALHTETFASFTAISRILPGERTNFVSGTDHITWADYLGKIVLVTIAADPATVGSYAIVQAVAPSGDTDALVYTTPFTKAVPGSPDSTIVNPADGDTYVIVDTLAADFDSFFVSTSERLSATGDASVEFQNLTLGLTRSALLADGTVAFFSCAYDGGFTVGGTGDVVNYSCRFMGDVVASDSGRLTIEASYLDGTTGNSMVVLAESPNAYVYIWNDTILSGDDASIEVSEGTLSLAGLGIFDTDADVITLSLGARCDVGGYIYGDNNDTHIFVLGTACRVIAAASPIAASTLENVSFGDVIAENWAGLPFIANAAVTDSQAAWLNA